MQNQFALVFRCCQQAERCKENSFVGSVSVISPFVSLEGHCSSKKAFALNVFQECQYLDNNLTSFQLKLWKKSSHEDMPQHSCILCVAKMEYHLQSWNLVAAEEIENFCHSFYSQIMNYLQWLSLQHAVRGLSEHLGGIPVLIVHEKSRQTDVLSWC